METRKLIALGALLWLGSAVAAELDLPQSQEEYRQLLEEAAPSSSAEGRLGKVIRISARTEAKKGSEPALTNPPVDPGDRQLQPVTVAGKGAARARQSQRDTKSVARQVTVRWEDGSVNIIDLSADQSFKVGDEVVLRDGRLAARR